MLLISFFLIMRKTINANRARSIIVTVNINCTKYIVSNSCLDFIGKTFSRYDHTNTNNGIDTPSIIVPTFFML